MILSCLTVELRSGSYEAVEEIFRRFGILERASQVEGCRALYLASDPDHDGRARVVGVWDDPAAYQRWLDHPQRSVGAAELHALMADTWDPSAPGVVWPVLHVVETRRDAPQLSGPR